MLVPQPNGYSCGPASAYIALYGCGVAGAIEGTTASAKINTLAGLMGTDPDGTIVGNIISVMNSYLTNKFYGYA